MLILKWWGSSLTELGGFMNKFEFPSFIKHRINPTICKQATCFVTKTNFNSKRIFFKQNSQSIPSSLKLQVKVKIIRILFPKYICFMDSLCFHSFNIQHSVIFTSYAWIMENYSLKKSETNFFHTNILLSLRKYFLLC